jgi:adenylyltransferase/sulfurtransferase
MNDQDRYSRQILFAPLGPDAQKKLQASRVTLIGCGALGTVLADTLVRAGVGSLRIVDRDYVELNNLQRQVLFTEEDAAEMTPKAVAAARRLASINAGVIVEPVIADAIGANIESFAAGAQLLLDGTDNFETRFLINDVAVKHAIPWVYGACIGAEGMVMPILPRATPCLRCVWEQPPPPGTNPTCDTAGVIAPIVHIVASLQAVEAIKILSGKLDAVTRRLVQVNAWTGQFDSYDMQGALAAADCPCCKLGRFEYLAGTQTGRTATLCGRDAVQIGGRPDTSIDFEQIAAKVRPAAKSGVQFNRYLLRFEAEGCQVTLFKDGRAIIKGTREPDHARTIYARYVGA